MLSLSRSGSDTILPRRVTGPDQSSQLLSPLLPSPPFMSSSASHIGGVACDDAQLSHLLKHFSSSAFSSTALVYLQAIVPAYLFTTAQAAKLVATLSMSNDRLKAIAMLHESLSNPQDSKPLLDLFSMSSDKSKAEETLKKFLPHAPCKLAVYKIEDDGHRSAADMQRLISAMDKASMSSDKVAAVEAEIASHPSPPFEPAHLVSILKKFSFSSDALKVLNLLVPTGMVYPMTCAQLIEVLKVYSMSSDQLAMLPVLKKFIVDPQNKLDVIAHYSMSSDKEKAELILRDCVIRKQPPTPPAAAIQAALKKVGKCPAGYDWNQIKGGWRCAAGGHYVADAQLAAAMK